MFFSFSSDFSNGGDGMLATSSNGSQYSGSRVETPVSYVGDDDDDDDDFNENDDDDWCPLLVDYFLLKIQQASGINCSRERSLKLLCPVPQGKCW